MKRCLATLGATIALVLAVCAGPALAGDPPTLTTTNPDSALQSQSSNQGQEAKNSVDQDANSDATSAPGVQSNLNAPVRVGSNGNNGDVNQSNGSTANAEAENNNKSSQGIDQGQNSGQTQNAEQDQSSCCNGGGKGDPQSQRSSQKQKAKNSVDQDANSTATSAPGVQSNVNEPVTVASNDCNTVCAGGDSGDVNQSNSSTANSEAERNEERREGKERRSRWAQDQ